MEERKDSSYPFLHPYPTAPPLAHQEIYPAVSQRGGNCCFCSKVLQQSQETVVSPKCGHNYHLACGTDWVSKHPHSCRDCHGDSQYSKTEYKPAGHYYQRRMDFQAEGIPIDHGNDPELTAALEARFGKQGIMATSDGNSHFSSSPQNTRAGDKQRNLNFLERTKLRLNPVKTRETVHWRDLQERSITIDKLIKAGFSLLDMYSKLDMKRWTDLLDMGLRKEHITKLELTRLLALYHVSYQNLKNDLGVNLTFLFQTVGPSYPALLNLGLEFSILESEGLSVFHIKDSELSPSAWAEIGMGKDFLIDKKIGPDVITDILGWNILEVCKAFQIGKAERDILGINLQSFMASARTNKL